MCLCEQTAVHAYNSQQSFLDNLVGWRLMQWFSPTHFGDVDCSCANAYLPAAMGAGLYSLFAIVLALGAGAALTVRPKLAAILGGLWASVVGAGIYADYAGRADWKHLLPVERQAEHAEYLATYLAAVPAQMIVNTVVLLVLPAGLTCALSKLISH